MALDGTTDGGLVACMIESRRLADLSESPAAAFVLTGITVIRTHLYVPGEIQNWPIRLR